VMGQGGSSLTFRPLSKRGSDCYRELSSALRPPAEVAGKPDLRRLAGAEHNLTMRKQMGRCLFGSDLKRSLGDVECLDTEVRESSPNLGRRGQRWPAGD